MMREHFIIPPKAKITCWILIAAGVITLAIGFLTDPARTWVSILLNNFYFLSLSMGAFFFITLQYVTDSGWSAMFKRIPGAMVLFVPVAFIVMLSLVGGMGWIYEWAVPGVAAGDALIAHKSPYLNIPFFYLRVLVIFVSWMVLIAAMRRFSLKEDAEGGLKWFRKSKHYSMVFIFVFAITFSVASFDWIMSIDAHWFSTIFGIRAIISALYYSVALIILMVIALNRTGYLESLNKYHLNDFARYLFRLSIVWGYLWFMQYLIIWYADIPETTFYYYYRVNEPWAILFHVNVIINWTVPFLVLMSDTLARRKEVLVGVSLLLLAGFYLSLYLQVVPGSTGELRIGLVEIGSFAGFAGIFFLLFMKGLSVASIVPGNHPFLKESLEHHL
jgi:hypothetical protein